MCLVIGLGVEFSVGIQIHGSLCRLCLFNKNGFQVFKVEELKLKLFS